MLSTIRPIVVPLSGLWSAAGEYISYEVSMLYSGGYWRKLYTGKSFVDANGKTEMHIEKVLRDYLYRWDVKFNTDSQQYRPACLVGSIQQSGVSVEVSQKGFWNTEIEVLYYNSNNSIRDKVFLHVCGAWCPAFQKMDVINDPAEQVAVVDYIQNYATLATDILPHIPPVATPNFWLGLVLNVSFYNNGGVYIGVSSVDNQEMQINYGGTYAVAYPLAQLFAGIAETEIYGGDATTAEWYDEIAGGDATTAYSGDYDGGTADDSAYAQQVVPAGATLSVYWYVDGVLNSTPAAVVDKCAKKFYVSWLTPTGGWTAYGMDGNCTIESRNTKESITNLLETTEVLSVCEEARFNLYSGMVNKETYAHLLTMLSSRLLYVYDVESDQGWYCTCETGSAATLPSKTAKMQAFQIQLKSINNNEQ